MGSGWGTHVNQWLVHVNVWQKPLQYCKSNQPPTNKKRKKKKITQILVSKGKKKLHWGQAETRLKPLGLFALLEGSFEPDLRWIGPMKRQSKVMCLLGKNWRQDEKDRENLLGLKIFKILFTWSWSTLLILTNETEMDFRAPVALEHFISQDKYLLNKINTTSPFRQEEINVVRTKISLQRKQVDQLTFHSAVGSIAMIKP